MEHDLYTDADADRPDVICDTNGSVTLGLCKRCGKGEAQLDGPCRQASPNENWCVGCSPDNCAGCGTRQPSDKDVTKD